MKTLVLYASPHKDRNTGKLLDSFLKGYNKDVDIIDLYNLNIKPCVDCGYCKDNVGRCLIDDDMIDIYRKIENSDNIIIAAPMYFGMIPSVLKLVIDRSQMIWNKKNKFKIKSISKKKGVLLFTAGAEWNDMFFAMELICKYFFNTIGCEIVTRIYANNTDVIDVEHNYKLLEYAFREGKCFC
ncbi:flavodoxin family protein [Clostridium tepidiprofundi]|nr:flavodoxin family protein [Clostridium tepidiprofundi]